MSTESTARGAVSSKPSSSEKAKNRIKTADDHVDDDDNSDEDDDDDNSEDGEMGDDDDEDEGMEEDEYAEVEPANILGRRTRGKRIDYNSREALAKAGFEDDYDPELDDEE